MICRLHSLRPVGLEIIQSRVQEADLCFESKILQGIQKWIQNNKLSSLPNANCNVLLIFTFLCQCKCINKTSFDEFHCKFSWNITKMLNTDQFFNMWFFISENQLISSNWLFYTSKAWFSKKSHMLKNLISFQHFGSISTDSEYSAIKFVKNGLIYALILTWKLKN